jgi:hypothetical protein
LKSFLFCPLSEEFLQNKVNVLEIKNIFYNKTNIFSMINSKNGRPFWVVMEAHLVILQALIEVSFQLGPFVANLCAFTSLFSQLSIIPFDEVMPSFISNYCCPCRQQH